jgi:Rrf2 family protein
MLALAEAEPRGPLTAAAIGRQMTIPRSYVAQVMADLTRAGVARATLGRRGGYRLARSARAITLLDVVRAAEGTHGLRTCVMRGSRCGEAGMCQVHDAFAAGHEALLGMLGRVTLDDVARPVTVGGIE